MVEKIFLLDVDYEVEKDSGVVLLFGKNKDGKKILVKKEFQTYFFVLPFKGREEELYKKIEKLMEKHTTVTNIDFVEKKVGKEKRKLIKISMKDPRRIKDVRDEIKNLEEVENTFEYNIPFYKRFLIDYGIKPCQWIEIEGELVDENKDGFDLVFKATKINQTEEYFEPELKIISLDTEWVEVDEREKLIMISLSTKNWRKVFALTQWEGKQDFVESCSSEEKMIKRFVETIKEEKPDILVTYNGDLFDFLKLKQKAKSLRIKLDLVSKDKDLEFVRRGKESAAKIFGIVHIDLYQFIESILSPNLKTEVLSLDEVAKELIGEGKKDLEYQEMSDLWREKKELSRIAEYSMWDAYLTYELSKIILPQIFSISRLVGEIPFDVCRYSYSQLVEAFLIRKAVEDGLVIPNSPKSEEKETRMRELPYRGAIVVEPKKGIHENIAVLDFRSLYPTIIVTHNISPETLNCTHEECKIRNSVPETRYHFCTKEEGFISKNLKTLIERRRFLKERMKLLDKKSVEYKILDNEQYATKIISNAMYGYFAFVGARWYKRECAESTAAFGRHYISKVLEFAHKEGFEIIYGDTDSIFIRKKVENLEEEALRFSELVNESLPGIIELEFRGVYNSGIFVAREKGEVGAKKRYALVDKEGKLEIRGFEVVRRDWCKLAKEVQRKVLEFVLKDKDPEKAIGYVREVIKDLKDRRVRLEDLIIYEQITKPLSKYEQIGPHVKAAMKARERGIIITVGSIIGFVITKGVGSISDRAMPADFVSRDDYDVDYYVNNQVIPAALRVLKALGYTEDDITGKKVEGLGKFFKG